MFHATSLHIRFHYKGMVHFRQIDKINFHLESENYTLYRIRGKKCNYDLLKSGIWWEVNVGVDRLDHKLVEALGKAIDAVDTK